jgi:hypothetical protein
MTSSIRPGGAPANRLPVEEDGILRDDRTAGGVVRGGGRELPLPPHAFEVKRFGTGVRITIKDQDRKFGTFSKAATFNVHWAEEVDITTDAGRRAGFARSTIVSPALPAPAVDDGAVVFYLTDPAYITGYFYCTGVHQDGITRSDFVGPQRIADGDEGDVPGDITHFSVSESGEEISGHVYSAVSFSGVAPIPLGSYDATEIQLENYPNPGDISGGHVIYYAGPPGGSIQKKMHFAPCRRIGVGTITATNAVTNVIGVGTRFLSQARVGDRLEIGAVKGVIDSITSDTAMTISAPGWPGASVVNHTSWFIIGQVTFRAISIARDGSRRSDLSLAPSQTVLMDAELSAPNPITGFTLKAIGNFIRVQFEQVVGSFIFLYQIWRSTGASDQFANAELIHTVGHDPNALVAAGTLIQYDDSDFTIYQREQGQVFRYYVLAMNLNMDRSTRVSGTAACRLDTYSDTDPTIPSRSGSFNRLYNGFIAGTAGNNVDKTVGTPGSAQMGFTVPTGWTYWDGDTQNGHPTRPTHQNNDEVKFSPGADSNDQSRIWQDVGGWSAAAGSRKLKKGNYVVFQAKARASAAGTNGTLQMVIQLWNGGVFQDNANYRARIADDTMSESTSWIVLDASTLSTSWSTVWGVFRLTETVTCDVVRMMIFNEGVTNNDIYVKEVGLFEGDELTLWTHDMGDTTYDYPNPGGPTPTYPGGVGGRGPRLDEA